jgi:hypothetical protein
MDQGSIEQPKSQSEASAAAGTEEVAKLAYGLWLSRGCPDGSPEDDWYEAERILRDNAASMSTPPPEEISSEAPALKATAAAADRRRSD